MAQTDENGYINLKLQKRSRSSKAITSFGSFAEAQHKITYLAQKHKVCLKLCALDDSEGECAQVATEICDGACVQKLDKTEHNTRIQELIEELSYQNKNVLIQDRGRTISERSAALIENGRYIGYTFYDLNYQITNINVLRNIIVATQQTNNMTPLIQMYSHKSRSAKVIILK